MTIEANEEERLKKITRNYFGIRIVSVKSHFVSLTPEINLGHAHTWRVNKQHSGDKNPATKDAQKRRRARTRTHHVYL